MLVHMRQGILFTLDGVRGFARPEGNRYSITLDAAPQGMSTPLLEGAKQSSETMMHPSLRVCSAFPKVYDFVSGVIPSYRKIHDLGQGVVLVHDARYFLIETNYAPEDTRKLVMLLERYKGHKSIREVRENRGMLIAFH